MLARTATTQTSTRALHELLVSCSPNSDNADVDTRTARAACELLAQLLRRRRRRRHANCTSWLTANYLLNNLNADHNARTSVLIASYSLNADHSARTAVLIASDSLNADHNARTAVQIASDSLNSWNADHNARAEPLFSSAVQRGVVEWFKHYLLSLIHI